jgi:hypothetical protein
MFSTKFFVFYAVHAVYKGKYTISSSQNFLFSVIYLIKTIYVVPVLMAPAPRYIPAAILNPRAAISPSYSKLSEIRRLTRLVLGELFLKSGPDSRGRRDERRRATVRQHEGLVSLLASAAAGQRCAVAGLANR